MPRLNTLASILAAAGCLFASGCSKDPAAPGAAPVILAWKEIASGTPETLHSVEGRSANNMFAFGNNGTIRRFNGEGWTISPGGGACHLRDSWQAPSGNIYAAGSSGSGCILINDGGGWDDLGGYLTDYQYRGIWGFSDDDIFLTGVPTFGTFGARIIRWDGNDWNVEQVTQAFAFFDLWGKNALNLYAVGGAGIIYKFDGANWGQMTSPTAQSLNGVWGFDSDDVFAFGDNGTILHYDGIDWVSQTSGILINFFAGWGPSPDNVFAVGEGGAVLHYNGSEWSEMESSTDSDLRAVYGSSGQNVFAVGDAGQIIRYSPE